MLLIPFRNILAICKVSSSGIGFSLDSGVIDILWLQGCLELTLFVQVDFSIVDFWIAGIRVDLWGWNWGFGIARIRVDFWSWN